MHVDSCGRQSGCVAIRNVRSTNVCELSDLNEPHRIERRQRQSESTLRRSGQISRPTREGTDVGIQHWMQQYVGYRTKFTMCAGRWDVGRRKSLDQLAPIYEAHEAIRPSTSSGRRRVQLHKSYAPRKAQCRAEIAKPGQAHVAACRDGLRAASRGQSYGAD